MQRENGPSVLDRPRRWKLHKANWTLFQVRCEQSITRDKFTTCQNPTELITTLIHNAASEAVQKTTSSPKNPNKPWFTEECKKATAERKSALRSFNLRPTEHNHDRFKIARAKDRRTIKRCKRTSWREFVSRLNSRSSVKKTWEMVRRIEGKSSTTTVTRLNSAGKEKTMKTDIANALADTFSKKSSSTNYSETFQKFKEQREKARLNFKTNNTEAYNTAFSMKELKMALKKCLDTAPVSDEIHYQFLKHLPFTSLHCLLDIGMANGFYSRPMAGSYCYTNSKAR